MKVVALFLLACLIAPSAWANCTLSIELSDAISPATFDYMERAAEEAKEKGCVSILARINTPGGSLQSTRKIVELIMNSPIPYLCVIHPAGGHAGSAGAIIMQACHVNGAMEATNIGAASPVAGTGQEMPEDLRKKMFEDTRSWVKGLANYRGRSEKFAVAIVDDAKALAAKDALEAGAIDVVATDLQGFLDFAKDRSVRLDADQTAPVQVATIRNYEPDMRYSILQIFANPQWAYLLFMASLGLLYYEFTNPGTLAPGVVGAMGLVISLMNFHLLDVSWGGVLLIVLGVAFIVAELFVPSFGALGLGGLASFVVGSLLLFDESSGYHLPMDLLFSTSFMLALVMGGVTYLAYTGTQYGKRKRNKDKLPGQELVVQKFDPIKKKGIGKLHGELWKIKSKQALEAEDEARVVAVKGLTLVVERKRSE
jgi:membrane-bound serine protease (ClpP class)